MSDNTKVERRESNSTSEETTGRFEYASWKAEIILISLSCLN